MRKKNVIYDHISSYQQLIFVQIN